MYIVKIASLNINGIRSQTRVGMMVDFLSKHDIDIALVQEITDPESVILHGYASHLNIGPDMRGTAIMAKKDLHLTKIERIPSGRAIAAEFNGIAS
jgi:exonuclease III